jgi:hypothetical protein
VGAKVLPTLVGCLLGWPVGAPDLCMGAIVLAGMPEGCPVGSFACDGSSVLTVLALVGLLVGCLLGVSEG